MKASIKNTVLPYRGEPTRAAYKKPVVGDMSKYLRVQLPCEYNPRPAPIPAPRPKPKEKAKEKPRETKPRKRRKNASFWTPENEEKLIQMYKDGAMYDEMARVFDKSRGGISSRIQKLVDDGRLDHRMHIASWAPEEVEMLKKLRDEGMNFGEISDRLGRSAKACSEMYRRTYG